MLTQSTVTVLELLARTAGTGVVTRHLAPGGWIGRVHALGGLAGLVISAVALGFGFFFFNQLCLALGRSDGLPPGLAAWSPPLLALLSGLTLLCYTEDG